MFDFFDEKKLRDACKKQIKELEIREENIKKIISTCEYISWLESFTENYSKFSSDQWVYFPEEISEEDRKNVEALGLFYDGINIYCMKNYIFPIENGCDSYYADYYCIKFNNVGYRIEIIQGQGTVFCCKRVSLDECETFIDFSDIKEDKIQPLTPFINSQLPKLDDLVKKLYKDGIPLQAIADCFVAIFEELKKTNKEVVTDKDN